MSEKLQQNTSSFNDWLALQYRELESSFVAYCECGLEDSLCSGHNDSSGPEDEFE
jgi:hypothetical protein